MHGTVLYAKGNIRFEDVPEPKIINPTDAIIRISATCVCGSDLWSYRGADSTGGRNTSAKEVAMKSKKRQSHQCTRRESLPLLESDCIRSDK